MNRQIEYVTLTKSGKVVQKAITFDLVSDIKDGTGADVDIVSITVPDKYSLIIKDIELVTEVGTAASLAAAEFHLMIGTNVVYKNRIKQDGIPYKRDLMYEYYNNTGANVTVVIRAIGTQSGQKYGASMTYALVK